MSISSNDYQSIEQTFMTSPGSSIQLSVPRDANNILLGSAAWRANVGENGESDMLKIVMESQEKLRAYSANGNKSETIVTDGTATATTASNIITESESIAKIFNFSKLISDIDNNVPLPSGVDELASKYFNDKENAKCILKGFIPTDEQFVDGTGSIDDANSTVSNNYQSSGSNNTTASHSQSQSHSNTSTSTDAHASSSTNPDALLKQEELDLEMLEYILPPDVMSQGEVEELKANTSASAMVPTVGSSLFGMPSSIVGGNTNATAFVTEDDELEQNKKKSVVNMGSGNGMSGMDVTATPAPTYDIVDIDSSTSASSTKGEVDIDIEEQINGLLMPDMSIKQTQTQAHTGAGRKTSGLFDNKSSVNTSGYLYADTSVLGPAEYEALR